eukprot:217409_1
MGKCISIENNRYENVNMAPINNNNNVYNTHQKKTMFKKLQTNIKNANICKDINRPHTVVVIYTHPNDTIQTIKHIFFKKEDVPPEQQRLIYAGKQLENEKTLKHYAIPNKATLHVVLRLRGGGAQMNGPDVEAAQCGDTGTNNLLYYQAHAGLSYGGVCDNNNCQAFRQQITYNRGFGDNIHPLAEEIEEIFSCPGCKKPFRLTEFILFNCDATIIYKKKFETKKTKAYKPRNNQFIRLGKDGNDMSINATYNLLKFIVRKA